MEKREVPAHEARTAKCKVRMYFSPTVSEGLSVLGMRTRIFCLAPASQCVNCPTEASLVRALYLLRAKPDFARIQPGLVASR